MPLLTRREVERIIKSARNAGETPDFRHCNLAGLDLSGLDLSHVDFWAADMTSVKLEKSNLEGAVLYRANLTRAYLYRTHLKDTNLGRSSLVRASLIFPTLTGTDLSEVDLTFTYAFLDSSDMRGAKLFDADLSGLDLSGANLEGAEYSPKTIWPAGFDYETATGTVPPDDEPQMYCCVLSKGRGHVVIWCRPYEIDARVKRAGGGDYQVFSLVKEVKAPESPENKKTAKEFVPEYVNKCFAESPETIAIASFTEDDDTCIKAIMASEDDYYETDVINIDTLGLDPSDGVPYPLDIAFVSVPVWAKLLKGHIDLPTGWAIEKVEVYERSNGRKFYDLEYWDKTIYSGCVRYKIKPDHRGIKYTIAAVWGIELAVEEPQEVDQAPPSPQKTAKEFVPEHVRQTFRDSPEVITVASFTSNTDIKVIVVKENMPPIGERIINMYDISPDQARQLDGDSPPLEVHYKGHLVYMSPLDFRKILSGEIALPYGWDMEKMEIFERPGQPAYNLEIWDKTVYPGCVGYKKKPINISED